MHTSSACCRPVLAGHPSSPPPDPAKGAAVGPVRPSGGPPVEARPPLPLTKEEDDIAASSAASTMRNRLGRGSPAHRVRSRRSIGAGHRRQIGNAPRRPTSRTGTRSSSASSTARALPGGTRRRQQRREGERWGTEAVGWRSPLVARGDDLGASREIFSVHS
jgi:hypothetical protein